MQKKGFFFFLEPQAWLECLHQWTFLSNGCQETYNSSNPGKLLLHLGKPFAARARTNLCKSTILISVRYAELWSGWGLVCSFISLSKIDRAKQILFFMPFFFPLTSAFLAHVWEHKSLQVLQDQCGWRWKIRKYSNCFFLWLKSWAVNCLILLDKSETVFSNFEFVPNSSVESS